MGAAIFAFLCDEFKASCPSDSDVNLSVAVLAGLIVAAVAFNFWRRRH